MQGSITSECLLRGDREKGGWRPAGPLLRYDGIGGEGYRLLRKADAGEPEREDGEEKTHSATD